MTSTLSQRIQKFYDASSGLWEQVWGEHMHHGYYGADGKQKCDGSAPRVRKQAQIDLIEELLTWLGTAAANRQHCGCRMRHWRQLTLFSAEVSC